jgi:MFS family permease
VGPGDGWSIFSGALVLLAAGIVLVSEIVAMRVIAPYVGVTLETLSAVIGCILAGISLGSWLGGVAADRWPARWVLVGAFSVGGVLLVAAPYIARALGDSVTASDPKGALGLTVASFLLPAVALSAVAPTILKTVGEGRSRLGSIAGALSAVGTLGALAGNFGAGFVLVGSLRSGQILVLCGVVSLGLGALTLLVMGKRTRVEVLGACALLVGAGVAGIVFEARLPCTVETEYVCLNIEALGPDTYLVRSNIYSSSVTDVADPFNLGLYYARDVTAVVEAAGGAHGAGGADGAPGPWSPSAFGYIGAGGYTLPLLFETRYRDSTHLVYEIDRELVDAVAEGLGIADLEQRFPSRIGDARVEVRSTPAGSLDVLLGDAFTGISVPWHLTTVEFLADVRTVLAPSGLYVMNLIDYDHYDLARAQAQTLRLVFADVVVIAPSSVFSAEPGADGPGLNIVLVGGASVPSGPALDAALARADSSSVAVTGAALDTFIGDADVLTDDFAPVDQLLGRP